MDEQPLRIAVLGAGPIGLEAALYGRYLGYDVTILERGEIAESVRNAGDLLMSTPFGMNVSPLGMAALEAQDPTWKPPELDRCGTTGEWLDGYLLPLAASDLLSGIIKTHTTVVAITRYNLADTEADAELTEPSQDESEPRFRLSCRKTLEPAAADAETYVYSDVVMDATGIDGDVDTRSLSPSETRFYRLGIKGHGGNSNFLFQTGLQQIRDSFAILGERAELDVYATIRPAAR